MLTIDTLPNDVLLEIFAFCVSCPDDHPARRMGEWQSLVQVCKRWQETIYASPQHLDLFLYLLSGDLVAETLDRWPELPLILSYHVSDKDDDNIHDGLTQRDRIRRIELFMTRDKADWIAKPMEQQFPHLTHLYLTGAPKHESDNMTYISLGRYLGGSAPSLQHLRVNDLLYEGLPSLLSSAPNLIWLQILCINPTGYMSPEVMAGALAGLTQLKDLYIDHSTGFPSFLFHDKKKSQSPHSPSPDRVILPALTMFLFGGHSEYLEDLAALIDMPRLENLYVVYAKNYDDSDSEERIEASNFLQSVTTFKHAQFRRAELTFGQRNSHVEFSLPQGECQQARVSLTVMDKKFNEEDPETPFLATAFDMIHMLSQLAVLLSDVQHLYIKGMGSRKEEQEERILESGGLGAVWFPLLRSFPAVDVLHVSWKLAGSIALAINDAPENMVAQVLPALQVLWLGDQAEIRKGKLLASTRKFLYLRKKSGRPVDVINSHYQLVQRSDPR